MDENQIDAICASARNPAADRIKGDEVALGMIVRLSRTGEIARYAALTGHDFIFIDMQHASYSVETVSEIAHTALGCGVAPMVRVRSVDDPNIAVLLDSGVTGLIFPNVDTPEQARRAVEAAKFAPIGKRSAAGTYPNFNFAPIPLDRTIDVLNETTMIVCMIESRLGLKNAEAIAAVPGVDVLHIGCSDLLIDMGIPGQMTAPVVAESIRKVIAAAKKHGKASGLGGDKDPVRQAQYIGEGIRFVTTHTDAAFLIAAATERVHGLRNALAKHAA